MEGIRKMKLKDLIELPYYDDDIYDKHKLFEEIGNIEVRIDIKKIEKVIDKLL